MWFHGPLRADRWHVHDVTCHAYVGGRGLAIGHVFSADGAHVATFAQEALLRDPLDRG
jgi:acyl-CoA thioesterase-2